MAFERGVIASLLSRLMKLRFSPLLPGARLLRPFKWPVCLDVENRLRFQLPALWGDAGSIEQKHIELCQYVVRSCG